MFKEDTSYHNPDSISVSTQSSKFYNSIMWPLIANLHPLLVDSGPKRHHV